MTNTFKYETNIILGHLFNFKNINIFEQEKYKKIGEDFLKDLTDYDSKIVRNLTTKEKKARNHKLISVGALFEIAKITEINLAILIGYLNSLHGKQEYYLSQCELDGKLYFLKGGTKYGNKIL